MAPCSFAFYSNLLFLKIVSYLCHFDGSDIMPRFCVVYLLGFHSRVMGDTYLRAIVQSLVRHTPCSLGPVTDCGARTGIKIWLSSRCLWMAVVPWSLLLLFYAILSVLILSPRERINSVMTHLLPFIDSLALNCYLTQAREFLCWILLLCVNSGFCLSTFYLIYIWIILTFVYYE